VNVVVFAILLDSRHLVLFAKLLLLILFRQLILLALLQLQSSYLGDAVLGVYGLFAPLIVRSMDVSPRTRHFAPCGFAHRRFS